MKCNKVAQHSTRFIERAIPVILAHPILLQKIVFEHPCNLQCDLVIFAQRALPDELHDFREVFLFLQDLLGFHAQLDEPWLGGFVMWFEDFGVFRVRLVPINGGEVFALGELFVETPEDLYDAKGGGCYRI